MLRTMLRTGDIILFNEHPGYGFFACMDWAIRCWTNSPYSHSGIIIVDPPWPCKAGTYVWDSSKHFHADLQDGKIKFGVALVPIDIYVNDVHGHQKLYKRSPIDPKVYDLFTQEKLIKLHDKVYGKHYDTSVRHWLAGMLHILIPRTETTFFCSAFVSYALTEVGVLDAETDWTIVSPAQLSSTSTTLKWKHAYGPDTIFSDV